MDGVDHHVRPEPGTIFADAPTLRLKSSLLSGGHQRACRQPVFPILGAIKYGKMLANNLLSPIALDTFGANIPISDNAVCIQHLNVVIRDTPDEKPEASFALTKPRQRVDQLSGALFYMLLERFVELTPHLVDLFGGGKIDQHVHRADQPAGIIMQRRRIGHERDARSVGPLGYCLATPDRSVFLQSLCHRALAMCHRPTIGPIQAPGNAPLVAADFWRATRKLHCGLIEKGDSTGGIGRVDRRWQSVQQVAKMPTSVAELSLGFDLLLHIPADPVLKDAAVSPRR